MSNSLITIDGQETWPKPGFGAMGKFFFSLDRYLITELTFLTLTGLSEYYGATGDDEAGKAVLRRALELGCTVWSEFFRPLLSAKTASSNLNVTFSCADT